MEKQMSVASVVFRNLFPGASLISNPTASSQTFRYKMASLRQPFGFFIQMESEAKSSDGKTYLDIPKEIELRQGFYETS